MLREGSLEEISDGRLYGLNDMVKADCQDCKGCSACCHGMGESIVLDPMDGWRLGNFLGKKTEELLAAGVIELNVADGIVLPNIAMKGESEQCRFLDEKGRCSVHPARPGICRLFPLGRYYEEGSDSFHYFLQIHECQKENRTKVKVKKWIDTPDPTRYDRYIADWHGLLKKVQKQEITKEICMYLLQTFYLKPYSGSALEEFYLQYEARRAEAETELKL